MNYVSWNELIQYSIMLIAVISLTYNIFHNNKRK